MKKTLLFIACMLAALTASAQEANTDYYDYVPFAMKGKLWHVVRSDFGRGYHHELYRLMDEGTVQFGKSYLRMYRSEDDMAVIYDAGLLREEDRKVYIFDTQQQKEFLVFDYSLKAGDTYESFSPDEQKTVTYQVLSVGPCTTGPKVTRDIQESDSTRTQGRYLLQWTVCRTDDHSRQKTWIEGVGSAEGPLANLTDEWPASSNDYLAYVRDNDGNLYLPFSFQDTVNNEIRGCNVPAGRENQDYEWHHQLTYELEGNRLHVFGEAFINCGLNNYAYFIEEPTDDPQTRKIRFVIEELPPSADCFALYATDFYVSGFDPNINYIVVDNHDEEHPVINKTPQTAYRPFVEDGKVWKVGSTLMTDNLVKMVSYYYFDGDTIVDGKPCKRMMCQRYVSPDYPDYAVVMQYPLLWSEGAWYEENQKVYAYNDVSKQFQLMYDFSANNNDTLQINGQFRVIGPKQTGGIRGFKGVYRDVLQVWHEGQNINNTTWLEGIGGIDGPTVNVYDGEVNHALFLMSCTVGDEVIYLNDEYEDGATPQAANAAKQRIDFTHIIKIKPKAPLLRSGEPSLYGEYTDRTLGINLNAIDEAYLVRIIDEAGKAVYERAINAGSIVGLNIDISSYAKGSYTVMVDNSYETFTAQFDVLTTAIHEVEGKPTKASVGIYNLQGQRISSLQRGLNIVNGKKVLVK